jgi:hypothetical protein
MQKNKKEIVLNDQIIKDIHEANRRLLHSNYVHSVNFNQIKQLLSGNKKSLMYGRIDHLHKDLWGKYPEISLEEIQLAIEKYVVLNSTISGNDDNSNNELELAMKALNYVESRRQSLERRYFERDDKYDLFCNVDKAKKFTIDDLNSLADWSITPEGIKDNKVIKILPIEGKDVPFYSIPEYNTYIALRSKKLIQHFRVQSLKITHSTYQGKLKPYYPDFVFLTPEGYLAIVESKPIVDMSNFYNRCKYYALKLYCESMGFIYAMVDENLVSLDSILKHKVINPITKSFDEILEKNGQFNHNDLEFIFRNNKAYTQLQIREVLSKHIAQKNLVNYSKYGFEISSNETIDFKRL